MSEERIQFLAGRMARAMIEGGAVDPRAGAENVSTLIAQVLLRDQKDEEKIEEEARQKLLGYPRLPPEGSGEYEALFEKVKSEVAARKGYPL